MGRMRPSGYCEDGMRYLTSPDCERDMRSVNDAALVRRVEQKIAELAAAGTIREVSQVRRLRTRRGRHYRIRVGDYRLGVTVVNQVAFLVRFGHRRDFYRGFP